MLLMHWCTVELIQYPGIVSSITGQMFDDTSCPVSVSSSCIPIEEL